MGWFQGGRAEPPPAFGFVRTFPPSQAQQDLQRRKEASRQWEATRARVRMDQIHAEINARGSRETRQRQEILRHAEEEARTIKRARAEAGPRWGEDLVDWRCRLKAEDRIRRQKAAQELDAVDLALQRGGGPAPTRRSGGAGKSRAQLAEELRALLPPGFQAPTAPQARRSVRLRPAMAARWETRG